ncbi:hypothetical protein [Fischerella thermalis]|jgi:hypothetical protein|nr:hypothetical protein [Fischerella thermalis]
MKALLEWLVLPIPSSFTKKNFDLADCKIAENLTTGNLLFTLNICLETDD